MKITEFSIKRKVSTTMLALIIVVFGSIAFTRLGLDFFPDVEFPTVSVITVYAGASPEDIENTITRPLEQVINSVSRVKKVNSVSSEGLSIIMVEFEWGTNLDFAAQDVRDQIGFFQSSLPEAAIDSLVVKFNLVQFPIMIGGITSDLPIVELKKLVEDEIAPKLQRVDGVASFRVYSAEIREIIVDIDKAALESRNISQDQVLYALRMGNLNLPAGHIVNNITESVVRTIGEFESLEDIRSTIVGFTLTGKPISIRDVADVKDTLKENRFIARIKGGQGLVFSINKRSGANTVSTAEGVNRELENILANLSQDVSFYPRMDQSEIIQSSLRQTRNNFFVGGFLAVLLILLSLRSWRPTIIIVLAIPLSVLTTFIVLYAIKYTINIMTLGGLALGIGMLVDNAVVVIENVFRHLEEGSDETESAKKGSSEISMAITASTLTTIAVFFPMMFASGITGKMAGALAVSIAISLLASLFVAFTLVPMAASLLLKKQTPFPYVRKVKKPHDYQKVKAFYQKALLYVLKKRIAFLSGAFGLVLLSFVFIPFLGTEFIPAMDYDWLILSVKMPVGTAIEETNRVVVLVEKVVLSEPGVEAVSSQMGTQAGVNPQDLASSFSTTDANEGLLWIKLVNQNQRKLSNVDILENIRQKLPRFKNIKVEALDVTQAMTIGAQAPIDIKVSGKDFSKIKQIADRIVQEIQNVDGLRDVYHTMEEGKPEYHIKLNRRKVFRMGLIASQIASALQTTSLGTVVTRYRDGNDEVDVRVRFKKKFRDSLEDIQKIPIIAPFKPPVHLDQVATISQGEGPIQITRENQTRKVSILANIADRDLGSIIQDINKKLKIVENSLPAGYRIEYGGQYKEMKETFVIMSGAFILAILLVYMILASLFESFVYPFIIMFSIPLAFIGVVSALLLSGKPISLPVLIGFVILGGIAVNNGIVLVDYINQLKKRGVEKKDAILQACSVRLRPVLITALTTIFGMLPMALSTSAGSELRAPMAITVVGGLTTTTFLTLFIIPIIYSLIDRVKFK
ncbi:MAG: efflux RND transporter permease subunit [Candidatus Aminicenantes bacterium]|nr:efflux RND transporter permease subunit [Candidatus Aminicenantes bacterium]